MSTSVSRDCVHGRLARSCEICELLGERDRYRAARDAADERRAEIQRAFNRLDKAVTNHIAGCFDCDELAHVQRKVYESFSASASERRAAA